MKLVGSQTIPAAREIVWAALNDPTVLKQCIPGCETITLDSPTDMKAKVVIKLGPVKASFQGKVKLSELNPPESYRISGKGEGGLAGFAEGEATVKLTAISATETEMDYDVEAQVGGKLAMLGGRLIDSTAQSLAQQFFDKFASVVAKMDKPKVAKKVAPKKLAVKKPVVKKAAAKKAAVKKKVK